MNSLLAIILLLGLLVVVLRRLLVVVLRGLLVVVLLRLLVVVLRGLLRSCEKTKKKRERIFLHFYINTYFCT